MRLVALDFETYYDAEYSLSKLTTEHYVRDDRFEALMVGLKVIEDDHVHSTYTAVGGDIRYALRELELEKAAVLCHHSQFDGLILNHHYGIRPKIWFDTIPMARAEVGSVAARGMSLRALADHFGIGVKGREVGDAKGKHLSDFSAAELEAYRVYCGNDVDLTYELHQLLWRKFTPTELKLIDVTTRLFTEPMLELDTALLEDYKNSVVANKATLLLKAGITKAELTSNPKFADVLRRMGVEPPMKQSPPTGNPTYAFAKTDLGMKALLEHSDEAVVAMAEARVGVKTSIAETRAQRFIDIAGRGKAPIYLKYWGAEQTGRHSAGDKSNFLNLGRRSPLEVEFLTAGQVVMTPAGRATVQEYDSGDTVVTSRGSWRVKECHKPGLRDSIRAPKGYKIVVGDSSNIEARKICYLAGQEDVLQKYRNNEDLYCDMASYVYKKEIGRKDPGRQLGKVIVLACGFGMGPTKFYDTATKAPWNLDISEAMAMDGVQAFRERYHRVKASWDYFNKAVIPAMASGKRIYADYSSLIVTGKECLVLPNGRMLRYPNLRMEDVVERDLTGIVTGVRSQWVFDVREGPRVTPTKLYGGKGMENITQAMARIVVMDQVVQISKRYRIVLPVYDEAVCCVPEAEAEACEAYVAQCLSTPPLWAPDLPLACETGISDYYGGAK